MNVRGTPLSLKVLANSQRRKTLALTVIVEKRTKLKTQYLFISLND